METKDWQACEFEVPSKKKAMECKKGKNKPCNNTCKDKNGAKSTVKHDSGFKGRFETCSEYKALLKEMNTLYDNYKEALYEIDENFEIASSAFDSFQDDVKKFRSEINSLLDLIEIKLLDSARKKKNEGTQAMIELMSEMSTHKTDLYEEISKMENCVKTDSLTQFVHSIEDGKMKTDALQKYFNSLSLKIKVRRVAFDKNESILDILKSTDLGVVKELEPNKRKRVKGRKTSMSSKAKDTITSHQQTKDLPTVDVSWIKTEPIATEDQSTTLDLNYDLKRVKEEEISIDDVNLSDNMPSSHSGLSGSISNSTFAASTYVNTPSEGSTLEMREDNISETLNAIVSQGKEQIDANQQFKKLRIKKLINLDVKHKFDSAPYSITGIVMIDSLSKEDESSRMALADYNNSTIRIVELLNEKHSYISHWVTLVSRPWDITCIERTQLICTVPDIESLVYLKIGSKLTVNKRLRVDGRCRGIDYKNDTLIVSFVNPASVKILDMEGKVLNSVSTDATGLPLFIAPYYVKSNGPGTFAFVSDWEKNTLTKIDIKSGIMVDAYLGKELNRPYGVAVDKYGRAFVAGWQSNNICVVSPHQRQIRPVIRVPGPFSIVINHENGRMYASHSSSDTLDVYKLY